MAGIYSQGGSAGHRYAGWLSEVEAKNFQFGGKVFNGSPSAIYVGSNLVWMSGWLTFATKQAIMVAFGADGAAVIRATNAYLNGIAATDMSKAQDLAGFINEDPMMVCSLPYETRPANLPIRWIYGAGGQYFDSGIKPDVNCTTSLQFKVKTKNNTYPYIFGADSTDRWAAWLDGTQMGLRIGNSSSSRPTISVPNSLGKPYILDIRNGVIKLNGEQKATYARSYLINYSIFIFGTSTQGNPTGNGAPMDGYISFTQIDDHYFVPILKDGSEQMIDIFTGNYATKHGTFSIVYTEADGVTPWTPTTP